MTLGENIKARRTYLKMSQEYVADQLGISRQAVAKWESGKSKPTTSNLVELAALFEISLSELIASEECVSEKGKSETSDVIDLEECRMEAEQPGQTGMGNIKVILPIIVFSGSSITASLDSGGLRLFSVIVMIFMGVFMGVNVWKISEQKRFKCALCELVFAAIVAVSGFVISHFTGNILTSIGIFAVASFYIAYFCPRVLGRKMGGRGK